MKNIKKFDYFSLIDDETSKTRRKIIKIIYKFNLNKTFEINEIINKALRQLPRVIIKKYVFSSINTSKRKFNHRTLKEFLQ